MLKHYLIVIRNTLSCSNPSLLLFWTEPINIESRRFQCQLKLESVTFFSVSRFLLHIEMCVGRTQRCTKPNISICEPGANNEHCPKRTLAFLFTCSGWSFLIVTGGETSGEGPIMLLPYSHVSVTHLLTKYSWLSKVLTSGWRLHRLAQISVVVQMVWTGFQVWRIKQVEVKTILVLVWFPSPQLTSECIWRPQSGGQSTVRLICLVSRNLFSNPRQERFMDFCLWCLVRTCPTCLRFHSLRPDLWCRELKTFMFYHLFALSLSFFLQCSLITQVFTPSQRKCLSAMTVCYQTPPEGEKTQKKTQTERWTCLK